MSVEVDAKISSIPCLPDEIAFNSDNPFITGKNKTDGYAQYYFPSLGIFLRNRFYLPSFVTPLESFYQHCITHAHNVTEMLRGNNPNFDPTFQHLPVLSEHYSVKDIPITITTGENAFIANVRVIESKEGEPGKKLRLVLFAFNENQQKKETHISPWNPKTTDELSAAPLEVLKALQGHIQVDSMMCFSLGAMTLDGLKHIDPKDADHIPKTLILNRSLTSIWKVASVLFPYFYWVLHGLTYVYGLDADPEKEVLSFFQRANQHDSPSMEKRHVVVFEATRDRYFSGPGALDATFSSQISATGSRVDHGKFFRSPPS